MDIDKYLLSYLFTREKFFKEKKTALLQYLKRHEFDIYKVSYQ